MRRLPSACRGGCVRGRTTPAGVYGARAEKSCSRAWGLPCRVVPGEDDSGARPFPPGTASRQENLRTAWFRARNFPLGPSHRLASSVRFFLPARPSLRPTLSSDRRISVQHGSGTGDFCPVLSSVRSFPLSDPPLCPVLPLSGPFRLEAMTDCLWQVVPPSDSDATARTTRRVRRRCFVAFNKYM